MRKLEIYSNQKTYMYPNGDIATPFNIQKDFPAVQTFKHVIETDEAGEVCFAVMNFSAFKTQNNIDMSLSDDEALTALEEIMNKVEEPLPSAEERIAAAMEFQNMVTLANFNATSI